MAEKILIVDDKASVRTVLHDYLKQHGYQVVLADNGKQALTVARHELPDLILLDVMMPDLDGYGFLVQYRHERNTPVIIITAKQDESDAVIGLELGADDFILKPFRMRELVARIHAVLRRASKSQTSERSSVGALTIDYAARQVTVDGHTIELTKTEFNLLAILIGAPGRVFSREELFNRLIDNGFDGLEKTINVHVHNLRCKIEPGASEPRFIETVFGIGYRLKATA
jgi:DNA-binding response OmpR family regulator